MSSASIDGERSRRLSLWAELATAMRPVIWEIGCGNQHGCDVSFKRKSGFSELVSVDRAALSAFQEGYGSARIESLPTDLSTDSTSSVGVPRVQPSLDWGYALMSPGLTRLLALSLVCLPAAAMGLNLFGRSHQSDLSEAEDERLRRIAATKKRLAEERRKGAEEGERRERESKEVAEAEQLLYYCWSCEEPLGAPGIALIGNTYQALKLKSSFRYCLACGNEGRGRDICQHCAETERPSAAFCHSCGQELSRKWATRLMADVDPKPDFPDEALAHRGPHGCFACGSVIEKDDSFCPSCGVPDPFIASCPKCDANLYQHAKHCQECGLHLDKKTIVETRAEKASPSDAGESGQERPAAPPPSESAKLPVPSAAPSATGSARRPLGRPEAGDAAYARGVANEAARQTRDYSRAVSALVDRKNPRTLPDPPSAGEGPVTRESGLSFALWAYLAFVGITVITVALSHGAEFGYKGTMEILAASVVGIVVIYLPLKLIGKVIRGRRG